MTFQLPGRDLAPSRHFLDTIIALGGQSLPAALSIQPTAHGPSFRASPGALNLRIPDFRECLWSRQMSACDDAPIACFSLSPLVPKAYEQLLCRVLCTHGASPASKGVWGKQHKAAARAPLQLGPICDSGGPFCDRWARGTSDRQEAGTLEQAAIALVESKAKRRYDVP